MPGPEPTVILLTRDAQVRERVAAARPAGVVLHCVDDATRIPPAARDVWIDLDARSPGATFAELTATRYVYFYSTLPDDHAALPSGLFLKKPCPSPALNLLFATPAIRSAPPARTAVSQVGRAADSAADLPHWILDFHHYSLRRLCRRIVRALPARLGYQHAALYLLEPRTQSLTLAQASAALDVDLGVSVAAPSRHVFADCLTRAACVATDNLARYCRTHDLQPPRDIARHAGPALLAPLRDGDHPLGLLMLSAPADEPARAAAPDAPRRDAILRFIARSLAHARRYRRAGAQARADRLTGLRNYRWMREALTREIRRAQRYQTDLAVVVLDLDGLKQVNDRHGHIAGNALLRHVARKISAQLRKVDAAARIGGDEFVVLLPATDLEGARQVADRILAAIRDDAALSAGIPLRTTASLGVAQWSPGRTAKQLLEDADHAMYAAKRCGANAVACAPLTVVENEESPAAQPTPEPLR